MAFKPSMSIANFTCRFGEKKVLIDLFDDVVYPAFFYSPPRVYSKNEFHLFDLELTNFGSIKEPETTICGRFVRNADLKRSHILRGSSLIKDSKRLESATGARFVLVLSSHTLLYAAETPHAPPISMFRSTMQHHLTKSWGKFIKSEYKVRLGRLPVEKRKESSRKILADLLKEIPKPELEIVELPSPISIENFLKKFETISRVEYRILETNHSLDFSPVIAKLREQKEQTESSQLILVESNPKNFDKLSQQLQSATQDGNVHAKLTGKAHDGGVIKGSNDQFSMSVLLEAIPTTTIAFAKKAYKKFHELVTDGKVIVYRAQGKAKEKVDALAKRASLAKDIE